MNISKSLFILSFFTVSFFSCVKNSEEDPTPTTSTTDTADTVVPLDQIEAITDYTYDANTANIIKLNGNAISISGTGAKASGSIVTISSAGTYAISGTLSNGQIIVQTDGADAVKLILNGIDVANSTTSPIFIDKAKKVIMFLPKGTLNKVSDGTKYTDIAEGQDAAIYSQAYLSIAGEGSLQVTANFADGIASKDGLVINNGNIIVNSKDDAIRGKDYLVIRNGNFTLTSTGDGLKSSNDTDSGYGYIQIDNGNFKITSQGDGLTAQTNLTVKAGIFNLTTGGGSGQVVAATASAKGFKAAALIKLAATSATINSADDGVNSDKEVIIEKGTYLISSADDGIHANSITTILDGNITITKAFEGIEAKTITIEKGNINITSTNDAINATAGSDAQQNDGSFIYIKGGELVLNAQSGDPLDSNGSISMTDGTIIIHGPSGMEVPIDYNATFVVSKGIIIASGGSSNMLQAPSTTSTVPSLKLVFRAANAANTFFNITDDTGQSLVTFKPTKSYASIIFTSDKLVSGKTYNVYTGGSTNESINVGGFYSTGTYSGGTLRGSVTVSSKVNSLTLN